MGLDITPLPAADALTSKVRTLPSVLESVVEKGIAGRGENGLQISQWVYFLRRCGC